jgi:hypothetical protein
VGVHFARQMFGQGSPNRLGLRLSACLRGCGDTLGLLCLQFFQLQLKLLNLAADLLTPGAEDHAPQLGDHQLQVLDLVVAAEKLLLLSGESFILG